MHIESMRRRIAFAPFERKIKNLETKFSIVHTRLREAEIEVERVANELATARDALKNFEADYNSDPHIRAMELVR